jgi:hypothetical protein
MSTTTTKVRQMFQSVKDTMSSDGKQKLNTALESNDGFIILTELSSPQAIREMSSTVRTVVLSADDLKVLIGIRTDDKSPFGLFSEPGWSPMLIVNADSDEHANQSVEQIEKAACGRNTRGAANSAEVTA